MTSAVLALLLAAAVPSGRQTITDATSTTNGKIRLSGDLGGTAASPQVTATHLAAPLPEAQGGSGAATLGEGAVTATGSTTARALKDRWADVVNVKDFGATGDGVTDDTAAIQAAIDAAGAAGGGEVLIPRGAWIISSTLALPSHVTLRGVGDATVLRLSLSGWGDSGDAAITMLNVTGASLRDLKIDGQGATRVTANHISYTVFLGGASHCRIENVTFSEVGLPGASPRPTGPALALVSLDAADDLVDPRPWAGLGSTHHNTIRGCRFVGASATYAFAVRLLTNWTKFRALADFTNRTEHNLVEACAFEGQWEWNHLELAGGGTVHNRIVGNRFTGTSLTAIDFDKGAAFNEASGNHIVGLTKTPAYVGDSTKSFRAINVHGSSGTYYSVGNIVARNILRNLDAGGDGAAHQAAISVGETATDTLVSENEIDGFVNQGGLAAVAVFLGNDTTGTAVVRNMARNVAVGIQGNPNDAAGWSRTRISGNDMAVSAEAVSLAGTSGSGEGVVVDGNLLRSTEATAVVAYLGPTLASPVFSANQVQGGLDGLKIGATKATATANVFRGQAGYSIRVRAGTTVPVLAANISLAPANGDIVVESGADEPTLVGNSFSGGATAKKGPRVSYGTAAPTTGTWTSGDTVWNQTPTAGSAPGWVCVSGGTPGTWKAMANLAP